MNGPSQTKNLHALEIRILSTAGDRDKTRILQVSVFRCVHKVDKLISISYMFLISLFCIYVLTILDDRDVKGKRIL